MRDFESVCHKMENVAKRGKFEIEIWVYISHIKKFRKQGLECKIIQRSKNQSEDFVKANISWKNISKYIPKEKLDLYIKDETSLPEEFSKRLYIFSCRAQQNT